MTKVKVGKGVSSIHTSEDGIEIQITVKKKLFINLFLSLWICGWLVGEISGLSEILDPDSKAPALFMLAWLTIWTLAGICACYVLLWNLKGREVIKINDLELKHTREFWLFSRSNEYEIAHINHLRLSSQTPLVFNWSSSMEFWGLAGGTIAFDYGQSTYKFGAGLDEAEARHIIEIIKSRYNRI